MNKYDQLVKQAENHLRACKACCTCKNATEIINRDYFKVNYHCNVYNKDVTRHTGFTCDCYAEK